MGGVSIQAYDHFSSICPCTHSRKGAMGEAGLVDNVDIYTGSKTLVSIIFIKLADYLILSDCWLKIWVRFSLPDRHHCFRSCNIPKTEGAGFYIIFVTAL